MEGRAHRLVAVRVARAGQPGALGQIEQQGEVGPRVAEGGAGNEVEGRLGRALAADLVGVGGVEKTVADDPEALLQRREDRPRPMLSPRGEVKTKFRHLLPWPLQDHRPKDF